MLEGQCPNIIKMTGSLSIKEKREVMQKIEEMPIDDSFVIVATGKYVGEGFDFPRLDTLFLAMPIAWKGKVAQYAGRLHRLYNGKDEVLIYDYIDIHIPVLERMYHKRVRGYAAIGYKIKTFEPEMQKISQIYDSSNYLQVFNTDVLTAGKDIIIVSSYMRKNRLSQMTKVLSKALASNVSVTIYTKPPESFKDSEQSLVAQNTDYLLQEKINVVYIQNINQKFAIIDKYIIWFGNVNFLSFGNKEESLMRLESFEIAGELLDLLNLDHNVLI
jgi:phosphatidylserine/phosphatidylglycerophosphate/cardiolipin synthase-like enzyme